MQEVCDAMDNRIMHGNNGLAGDVLAAYLIAAEIMHLFATHHLVPLEAHFPSMSDDEQ